MTRRLGRCNLAQRVAVALGAVVAIVLIASLLVPPVYADGGWFGYAPNANMTFPSRPMLFGRVGGYRPGLLTLWWLATDFVATAVAVIILQDRDPA
jgi:hypothetical protein